MALFRILSEWVQKAYMKIEAHIKQHVMIGIWSLGYLRYVADNDDNPKCSGGHLGMAGKSIKKINQVQRIMRSHKESL